MKKLLLLLLLIPCLASGQYYYKSFDTAGAPPASPDLLLDLQPGATVAFGTIKLDKDYTGDCLQVRRGSDNVLSEIGFLNDYVLDTVALKAHCPADCFVPIAYDHSGNGNHMTQPTAAAQPKIVSGGIVEKDSAGIPMLNFDGVNDNLTNVSLTWTNFGIFTKASANFSSATYRPIASAYSSSLGFILRQVGGTTAWWTAGSIAGNNNSSAGNLRTVVSNPGTGLHQFSFLATSGNADIYIDGVLNETYSESTTTTALTRTLSIGFYPNDYFDGKIQFFIFYPSDQTANRAAIEAIINAF